MKQILLIVLITSIFTFAREADTLYILQTTDVHGHIYPYNYFNDKPAEYGLAKIYTKVAEYRRNHDNVLLLDGGDMIQGTPMAYYFNKIESSVPNPMILTMNYMGYEAMAVGNHDIEQGLFVYNKAQSESNFPWLSANSTLPDLSTYFEPYVIYEMNDITVGIIGLTTPGIPMWLDSLLYPGINWTGMVETARMYADEIRDEVDVLMGLFHAGLNEGYSAATTESLGLPNENASKLVAQEVEGFDVILSGHSHREVAAKKYESGVWAEKDKYLNRETDEINNTLLLNAGSWGRNLGVVRLILQKDESLRIKEDALDTDADETTQWKIINKEGWLVSMKDVEPSKAILQLNDYYHKKTLKYIHTEIAEAADTLSLRNARFKDNALVELINKAQMDYTGADISFAAAFNDNLVIPPGPVTIRDVYGLYQYENNLYMVEMSGRQIMDFLNYSARYFVLEDGEIKADPDMKGYNYDMAEGIKYKIKVKSKKIKENETSGKRNVVTDVVLLSTGEALEPDKLYKVAMNSYRAAGGGGHMAAADAKDARILFKSSEEMRNILAEYIKKQGIITAEVNGNWKVEK